MIRRRERPGGLTAIGVLDIVLGVMLLLCYMCDGAYLAFLSDGFQDPMAVEMWDFLKDQVPGFLVFRVGGLIFGLVLGAMLLVTGIGLLSEGNWARVTSIFFACLAIVVWTGLLFFQFVYVGPAMTRFFDARRGMFFPGQNPRMLTNTINILTAIIGLMIVIYAIVKICVLLQRGLKEYLKRERLADVDDYREDWDRPYRADW